jgi:inhibitor of cysteine peptidase
MIDDSTFELQIITERPEDMMCTMALVPFEETISLDVQGLPAGTYTVKGFGLENSFTLDVDNK